MADYNVLLIFFNNLKRFSRVFDVVREVKPKKLFLYQDGPRNEKDIEGITACRKYIDDNLDWDCEVHKKYQEQNVGCDPSEYISQTWAFSIVDKCIVLEDDDVPSIDFFRFCWELLIKYENDYRISIICGMNIFDTYKDDYQYDYFFTKSGSIWGWASWRRVIDTWDPKYSWLDDEYKLKQIRNYFSSKKRYENFIKLANRRRKSGIEYYETILGVSQMLNNQLNIVPTKNLISNIGSFGGVHTKSSGFHGLKKTKTLFDKKVFSYQFPLRHPDYIFEDISYKEKIDKLIRYNFFEKVLLKLKYLFLKKS